MVEAGIRIIEVDGKQEFEMYLGLGNTPLWSPGGRWLAFNRTDYISAAESDSGPYLVDVDTWQLKQLSLPADSTRVDWVDIGSQ